MAERPVFVPNLDSQVGVLVFEEMVEFDFHPGFSVSQKQKSIRSLHQATEARMISPLLEVSTKSLNPLGILLSAFNLRVELDDGTPIALESAFQGSKVFEHAGPFTDLYREPPQSAKKDERLRASGKVIGFDFQGLRWPISPRTAFYDWMYIHALRTRLSSVENADELLDYRGFTDIEFNPKKSINCQARSCALYVALHKRRMLDDAMRSPAEFIEVAYPTAVDGSPIQQAFPIED